MDDFYFTPHPTTPTPERIARVEELMQGFDAHAEGAELLDADVRWWETCCADLLASAREHMEIVAADDATLAARIPEETYTSERNRHCRRNEVTRAEVATMRKDVGGWVMYLGGLLVGFERIEAESLRMPKRVQLARGQLRGFIGAIVLEMGCGRMTDDGSDE